jgi:hypothetical protein
MTNHAIILVGGPDSGKTNYLGRLWEALRSGEGALVAPNAPDDIKYVEDALAHLLQGQFAPRSDKNFESGRNFSIPVLPANNAKAAPIQIVVPDVSGELWKNAVETCELPTQWMDELRAATGALLFVRVGSDQNIQPLDWVTAAKFLRMSAMWVGPSGDEARQIPTQVSLCELLRFLEHSLAVNVSSIRPRVAILVTAWDRVDAERATQGPMAYLAAEYPLLAGRLADITRFDIRVFGVSVVGGDFIDETFKQQFLETADLKTAGYVMQEVDGEVQTKHDLTLPVAWVVQELPSDL